MAILPPTPAHLEQAARALIAGDLVAFPTETVYGLGADATNPRAVAKIFTAKGRPRFNPLIVHVANVAEISHFAEMPALAQTLADAFWPGPMTLVLPLQKASRIPDITVAGLDSVAVRVPSHPVAHSLIRAAGRPIAAPSANISGHVSATTAQHVAADFGDALALIIDGGPTDAGIESTIIDACFDAPRILRHGSITREQIEAATGFTIDQPAHARANATTPARPQTQSPRAPGQLRSHYAPSRPVRMNAAAPGDGEAYLGFGAAPSDFDGQFYNLSESGDVVEAAVNLFAALRELDSGPATAIAVAPIPETGIGVAINDRLRRAAAPRDA